MKMNFGLVGALILTLLGQSFSQEEGDELATERPPSLTTTLPSPDAYHHSDGCKPVCYNGDCLAKNDSNGPECFCNSSATIRAYNCNNVACGVGYENLITRPNHHGKVIGCHANGCLLWCRNGFIFENTSSQFRFFTCDDTLQQWDFTNTNCVENPNTDCDCDSFPSNCHIVDQTECRYAKAGQSCGIGVLTEYRSCSDDNIQFQYKRKCCVEPCPLGTGDVPECTCGDVWPNCDNVTSLY